MSIAVLAAASSTSTSAWDQPGTLGFLVVFGMAVILYFVFRSMSRHLRRVNEAARAEAEAADKADGLVTLADGSVTTSPAGNEAPPGH
jgi:hypothetical protein